MPQETNPPILLLKTKSSPHDGYDEFFSAAGYTPTFIPVLAHNFHRQNLNLIKDLFESGSLNPGPGRKYGGIIFTSQRAVEAFGGLVKGVEDSITGPASHNFPLYTVGPATARSLTSLRDIHLPHASIHGAETGTGENLALYILEHYNALYPSQTQSQEGKPPLLFLVGEQRRDIIPRTLMGEATAKEKRIGVEEVVVYETGVVEGFEQDFEGVLVQERLSDAAASASTITRGRGGDGEAGNRVIWVVVFSPTGCDAMVRVLKRDVQAGKEGGGTRRVYVATIGPTTRDHLVKTCGVQPDVCAVRPSPEGVGEGIEEFMRGLELS